MSIPTDEMLVKILNAVRANTDYLKRQGTSNYALSKALLKLAKTMNVGEQPPLKFNDGKHTLPEI